MNSHRLTYTPLALADLDAFHSLVVDEYVRRFLMDGIVYSRDWSEQRIVESSRLFETRDVGIWLVRSRAGSELVGFCGFMEIPSLHAEPQLIYALFERFAGQGYATEMAGAAVARAHEAGFPEILASVDEVNSASLRVL